MLDHKDGQLALPGVNYSDKLTLFKQMKTALKKFFGEQSLPTEKSNPIDSIKYEEVNATYNNYRRGSFNQRSRGKRGTYSTFKGPSRYVRKQNPLDPEGKPLKCIICESVLHFARDCPHSYENLNKLDSVVQAALFTGQKEELSILLSESINSAILDSGCSSTVAGKQWITCYIDSLTKKELLEVNRSPSDTVFKFGGGEKMKSIEKLTLPCYLAGKKCTIETDVVESDIPLLMSKSAMKKAGMKLDLVNDRAEIFGE